MLLLPGLVTPFIAQSFTDYVNGFTKYERLLFEKLFTQRHGERREREIRRILGAVVTNPFRRRWSETKESSTLIDLGRVCYALSDLQPAQN